LQKNKDVKRSLNRRSLERGLAYNNGSINEIWQASDFEPGFRSYQRPAPHHSLTKPIFSAELENQISISEEDTSLLRRTALILNVKNPIETPYLTTALGLRFNLSDNIGKLRRTRPFQPLSIRSDEPEFADRFFALDTAYAAFTHTPYPNLHTSIIGGYVEEMFAGTGGEILYRPHNKRFAIGADSWLVAKRDPFRFMNIGLVEGSTTLSAHVNGWYDIPKADLTLYAKAGRYLAEDIGATIGLSKTSKTAPPSRATQPSPTKMITTLLAAQHISIMASA